MLPTSKFDNCALLDAIAAFYQGNEQLGPGTQTENTESHDSKTADPATAQA